MIVDPFLHFASKINLLELLTILFLTIKLFLKVAYFVFDKFKSVKIDFVRYSIAESFPIAS